jgi:PEP-CTERM motif
MIRARPSPNIARVNCSPSMPTKVKLEPEMNTTYSTELTADRNVGRRAFCSFDVRSRHIAGFVRRLKGAPMRGSTILAGGLSLLAIALFPAFAIAIPVVPDTFEDGTTMGWFVPSVMGAHPSPPTNIATGGPAGVGDSYLQLVAVGGGGPGSRLSVLNGSQWTGDYLAAGIAAIRMDVNNFGPDEMVLRLLFEDFEGPGPPENLALTLADITVPAGSGWMTVVFDLSLANLDVEAFGTVLGALSDVDTLRIFHNPDPAFPGPGAGIPTANVTLGVDNITALPAAVPEPSSMALFAGGLAAALARRRRR